MKLFEWFSNGQEETPANPANPANPELERGGVTPKISKISGISDGRAFPETAHVEKESSIYINKIDKYIYRDERDLKGESKHARAANFANPANPAWQPTSPWNDRMQTLTTWFLSHIAELPNKPFDLGVGIHIAEPEQCYSMLRLDIESGPTGPRGRSGALEDNLMALMERWAIMHEDVDN